jgi:uncharacterized protein YjbJ (UPF0337 family)
MADARDDVQAIRRDIERTQSDMHETIAAIREKLDPENLKAKAQESVREATLGRAEDTMNTMKHRAEDAVSSARDTATDASSSILDTIRDNPIPAALAGIGIGWLMMNRSPSQRSNQGYYGGTRSFYDSGMRGRRVQGMTGREFYEGRPGSYEDYYEDQESRSRGGISGVAESAGEKAEEMKETASEKAGEMKEAASEMIGQVSGQLQERAGSMGRQTRYQYSRVEDRFQETMDTNPLAMGAMALAAGAAAALLFPSTLQERRFMGEARDNLMQQVQGAAQETLDKVQKVAGEAEETVKKQAHEEGLSS